MQSRHARSSRGPAAALTFLALLVLSLGTAWGLSRVQYRERPRWDEAGFPRFGEAARAPAGWRERWVVAVHPGCPHCRVSLECVAAARDDGRASVRVTALLVDTPAVPHDSLRAKFAADDWHWDRDGRWRRRWGHRVYGEVVCFDVNGKFRRTLPPFAGPNEVAERFAVHGLGSSLHGSEEAPR